MRQLNKKNWPYKIVTDNVNGKVDKALTWCCDNMGVIGKGGWYWFDGCEFYFRDEYDASMFALRWA